MKYETSRRFGSCPCGKGSVSVAFHSPEGMYSTAFFDDARIHCKACEREFELSGSHGNGSVTLRRKTDIAKARAVSEELGRFEDEVRRDLVDPLARELENLAISRGRRAVDWYPALRVPLGLSSQSEFDRERKRAGSLRDLIQSLVSHRARATVREVLLRMGRLDEEHRRVLDEWDRLSSSSFAPSMTITTS